MRIIKNSPWPDIPSLTSCIGAVAIFLCAAGVLFPKFIPFFGLVGYALNLLDTIFHETGHMLFGFLGHFIGVAGGTLGQLAAPALVLCSAYVNRMPVAMGASVLWIGQNLIHISPYIADARKLDTEFFQWWAAFGGPVMEKGNSSHHDWHTMLDAVGLLWADQILAWLVYINGIGLIVLSIAALVVSPTLWLRKSFEEA